MSVSDRDLAQRIEEGEAHFHAGRLQEAWEVFDRLSKEAPNEAMVWNDLGAVLFAGNRESEARDAFEMAARLAPTDADILLNLAELHLEAGRTEAALPHLRSFHDAHPTRVEGLDLLRYCGIRKDDRSRVLMLDFARESGKSRRLLTQALREGGLQVRDLQPKVVEALMAKSGQDRAALLSDLVRAIRPAFILSDAAHLTEASAAGSAVGAKALDLVQFLEEDGSIHANIAPALEQIGAIPTTMPAGDPVKPSLSVLVNASDDWHATRAFLDRMALQDLDATCFEVLIFFRGAAQDFNRLVRTERYPFALIAIDATGESIDRGRDAALIRARGDTIVCFDADARPASDNLRRHLIAHFELPAPAIVQGGIEWGDSQDPLIQALSQAQLAPALGAVTAISELHGVVMVANNLSLPTADLLDAGGFEQGQDLQGYGSVALCERLATVHGYACARVGVIRTKITREQTLEGILEDHANLARARVKAMAAAISEKRKCELVATGGEPTFRWTRLDARRQLEESNAALRGAPSLASLFASLSAAKGNSPEFLGHLQSAVRGLYLHARKAIAQAVIESTPVNPNTVPLAVDTRATLEGATSIVMVNLNGFPHVKVAVQSLRDHTNGNYELIVVDNGSNDGSAEWLGEQRDVRLIRLEKNLGAPAARNVGLEYVGGSTVLFCDNDVVFTPGWRETLLAHMTAHPDIGLVGPMSDVVSGLQKTNLQENPGESLEDFATRFHEQHRGAHAYTSRLILFFLLVRREVIEKIGGIDTRYGRWGFEDDDYSLRALKAGFQLRVAKDCFIKHLGSQTSRTAQIDYAALLQQNWEVFKARFGLPKDLPYAHSYSIEAILARPFDAKQDRVPYGLGSLDRRTTTTESDASLEAAVT